MSKSHNKKRNVGLVYEFLVRYISRALVENRQSDASKAVSILNKRFKVGTELYREFRLFNSLLTTTVSSSNVVSSIIVEARRAAKKCDIKKLDHEKSQLIREINHALHDPLFFNQSVNNYKTYATIQTLLNDWRSGGEIDIARMATYEDGLSSWIMEEKVCSADLDSYRDGDVNGVVVDVMVEKLEKKYNSVLTEKQRDLIRAYAVAPQASENTDVLRMMEEIRTLTAGTIDHFLTHNEADEFLSKKLEMARTLISSGEMSVLNDASVENHLKFIKLVEELQA